MMKWSNLKNNKCPQCNKDFTKGMLVTTEEDFLGDELPRTIMSHPCGFKINEQRYKEIVSSQVGDRIDDECPMKGRMCQCSAKEPCHHNSHD